MLPEEDICGRCDQLYSTEAYGIHRESLHSGTSSDGKQLFSILIYLSVCYEPLRLILRSVVAVTHVIAGP